jgi:two-component system, LytTR family, response regulator
MLSNNHKYNILFKGKNFVFRNGGELILIISENITLCKAEGSYTRIYQSKEPAKLLVCKPIKYFEKYLVPRNFLRVHRSYLINLEKVDAFSSKYRLILISDFVIPISRSNSSSVFIELLENGNKDTKIVPPYKHL